MTNNILNRFDPLHKGHAIEQVIFAFQFDSEIDEASLKEIGKAIPKDDDLPGRAEMRGVKLAIGMGLIPQQPAIPMPTPSLAGFTFSKSRSDGTVETELIASRSSFVYRTLFYTRWSENWASTKKYLKILCAIYSPQAKLASISLSYVDKFVWQGPADCDPRSILRTNSRYLSPYIFETSDLWHSHTGAFVRSDDQTKRLINVNIDYVDEHVEEAVRRAVVVKTVLADNFNQEGFATTDFPNGESVVELIDSHMQQLHELDKEILGDIINFEMAKRIALGD